MDSKIIENINKMFEGQQVWEPPPPLPERSGSTSVLQRGDDHRVKKDIRQSKTVEDCHWSSDDEFSELKTKNCANQILPQMRSDDQTEWIGKSVRFADSRPATFSATEKDAAFQDHGLKEGDKASEREAFVAWKFLVRYPELYVGKANSPRVMPFFQEDALFENQRWDFFYLFEPDEKIEDPILLVPTYQLEALLCSINKQLQTKLTIPGRENENKFYLRFGVAGTPVPRYLGLSKDSTSYKKLLEITPQPEAEDDVTYLSQIQRDEFVEIVKNTKGSWQEEGKSKARSEARTKARAKARSRKRAEKRFANRKEWGQTTKRIQRYLGLRGSLAPARNYQVFTGQDQAPPEEFTLNVDSKAPFEQEGHVVFVCFDVESYEKSPELVTELGFAILDTKKLVDVPPGAGARNWFDLIQGRHIRIQEYSYMKNSEYVVGCPESFMFGESDFVPLSEVLKVVEDIMSPKSASGELRKVVIVGHDINQDIKYLKSLDFDVYDMENLLEVADNQKMHQHRGKLCNGQSLCAILAGLDIPYHFLHNAGNDAVYTLQSLLCLAVLKRQLSPSNALQEESSPVSVNHKPELNPEAGWSTGGEDTDGGCPVVKDPGVAQKQFARMQLEEQEDSAGAVVGG